jgi:hypothetical protein
MLSQLFIRSSAISRNVLGYLLTRFLATLQILSLPSVANLRVSFQGAIPHHLLLALGAFLPFVPIDEPNSHANLLSGLFVSFILQPWPDLSSSPE